MRYIAFLISIVIALFSTVARAERRVALVIGNGAYEHVVKLPNPANDATAIIELLRRAGFEVLGGVDLKRDAMIASIEQFSDSMRDSADVAVVFYAGHGVQISGKNYLIPVDADLHSALDVRTKTVDADDVVESAGAAKVKVLLLDACRDNPFAEQMAKGDARSRALAQNSGLAAMQSGEGTLIAFATSPGATAIDGEGDHSPFTRALLDHIAAPGAEIADAMKDVRAEVQALTDKKQLPWENTNMTGRFYMTPVIAPQPTPEAVAIVAPAPVAPAPVSSLTDAQAAETTFWEAVQKSGRREEYQLYLQHYPRGVGRYSDLAELRIAELENSGPARPGTGPSPTTFDPQALATQDSSPATEDALTIAAPTWAQLQARLTQLGFPTGGADGAPGEATRHAIRGWQTARKYFVSGYFNKIQLDALNGEALPASPTPRVATRSYQPQGHAHAQGGAGPGNFFNSLGAGIGLGLGAAIGCKLSRC